MWSPRFYYHALLAAYFLTAARAWTTSPHQGRSLRSGVGVSHRQFHQHIRHRSPTTPGLLATTKEEQRWNNGKPLSALAVDESDGSKISASFVETESSSQQAIIQTTTSNNGFDFASMDREELISKSINALFLVICFGCAFYTIININQGMTRGWTQAEIAMRIPLDTWSSYEVALEESPIVTKTMINVIIYLLGDWLSQTVFAKQNVLEFDLMRTLRNGLIGLCFGPLVHEYYQFSDAVLPVEGGMGNRIGKIFMDQTIYLSVKCSLYIMAVNTLQGEDLETSTNAVKDKIGGIVVTAWKFWPLIHCITYTVIPARHRILWVNCVDLVWNAILASMSQKNPGADEEEELQDQDESPSLISASASAKTIDVVASSETPPELVLAMETTREGVGVGAHIELLPNATDASELTTEVPPSAN